jgi:hypothetical protein
MLNENFASDLYLGNDIVSPGVGEGLSSYGRYSNIANVSQPSTGAANGRTRKERARDFIYSTLFSGLGAGSAGMAYEILKYDYGYLYDFLGKGGADGLAIGLLGAAVPLGFGALYFLRRALSK